MASCSRSAEEVEGESRNGPPNWLELPTEVTTNILQNLSVEEILTSASQVCSLWWNICKNPLMWRNIDMTSPNLKNSELVKICRWAIARSCGHLEEISIEFFATDNILNYIAESSRKLRCMRLPNCEFISDEGLRVVALKLPLLEEIDITFTFLSKDSLVAIGLCCPLLKTLKFNSLPNMYVDNTEAFVIVKTMPQLRHLEIFGNKLNNKSLLAILDGCPLLEYLDMRHCYEVDLTGRLGKRCRQQIKEIRFGF